MLNILSKILCLVLVLQISLSTAVSGHNLRALNVQSQDSVLVICTGVGTKWIDADRYFSTGQIVEIPTPENVNESAEILACVASVVFDNNHASQLLQGLTNFAALHLNDDFNLAAVLFQTSLYLNAITRAPPRFSLS